MTALYESYKYVESNKGAVKTIPSYEVAEMMEVEHKHLLEKIDGFNKIFDGRKIDHEKYWLEGTYKNSRGKVYRCFDVTKRGCDFLANKSIGEKGVIFTDRYMDRFSEMEEQIKNPLSNMSKELQAIFMLDEKQQQLEDKVNYIEDKMTVNYELAENLRSSINVRAVEILGGKSSKAYKVLNRRLYSAFHKDIKKHFKVNSYKNLSVKNYDEAISYIEKWQADELLVYAIQGVNSQITFNEEVVTNE